MDCSEKVDFLIAGVQKGGTTAMHRYLSRHPEIVMARRKEVHFFDNEDIYAAGEDGDAAYHRFFPEREFGQLWGEATPIYSYWDPYVPRIAAYHPGIRLIIMLRDPVARALSHWGMEGRKGREALSFHDAIMAEPERLAAIAPAQSRQVSYADRGLYAPQIRRLLAHFSRDQLLFLRSEDLRDRPEDTLARVFAFLDISPADLAGEDDYRPNAYGREIEPETRAYLAAFFADDLAETEDLLGWDLSAWKTGG